MKTLIIYGSTTGTTEAVAHKLGDLISNSQVKSVSQVTKDEVIEADRVLLGSSTWGYGDLQDDFENYIQAIDENYKDKQVAVFGCGDSIGFSDVFCQAVDTITERLQSVGAHIICDPLKVDGAYEDNLQAIQEFSSEF